MNRFERLARAASTVALMICASCGGGALGPTTAPTPTEEPTNTPAPPPTDTPAPTATSAPEPTLTPYAGGSRIVFVSNREDPEKANLYTINPDGSEITLVPTGLDMSYNPVWSPDGNRIAFWSDDTGEELIYTVYGDGSNLTQITDFSSAMPDWSPDGSRMVFQSDHRNEPKDTPDLYVMDVSRKKLEEILDDPDIIDYSPQWSPDGDKILFVSRRTGKDELFVINTDGTGLDQITDSGDPVTLGVWSPDGSRIAFVYGQGPSTDLYVVDADGISNVVRLTADKHSDDYPAWSPDGERIVFASNRGADWDLWVVNVDGSDLTQLTDDEFYDTHPDWW